MPPLEVTYSRSDFPARLAASRRGLETCGLMGNRPSKARPSDSAYRAVCRNHVDFGRAALSVAHARERSGSGQHPPTSLSCEDWGDRTRVPPEQKGNQSNMKTVWLQARIGLGVLALLTPWVSSAGPIAFELLESHNIDTTVSEDLVVLHGESSFHHEGYGGWVYDMEGDWVRFRLRTDEPLAVRLVLETDFQLPDLASYFRWAIDVDVNLDGIYHFDSEVSAIQFSFGRYGTVEGPETMDISGSLNPGTHYADLVWDLYGYLNESDLMNEFGEVLPVWTEMDFSIAMTLELRPVATSDTGSPLLLLGLSGAALSGRRFHHFCRAKAT